MPLAVPLPPLQAVMLGPHQLPPAASPPRPVLRARLPSKDRAIPGLAEM